MPSLRRGSRSSTTQTTSLRLSPLSEEAIPAIDEFIRRSFPYIFIDPTGWKGYSPEKLKPLCYRRQKVELLINFMYDHINRATSMADPATVVLGEGWRDQLDPAVAGAAQERVRLYARDVRPDLLLDNGSTAFQLGPRDEVA